VPEIVLVLTTAPDDDRAEGWARVLVEERLAACVNVLAPMVSIYRWKGLVERETERQVIIKTTRDQVSAVQARLRSLHPYELPEFVVMNVAEGSPDYMRWVADQTRPH
jgi:periplasmic divalent cation tolerance protein